MSSPTIPTEDSIIAESRFSEVAGTQEAETNGGPPSAAASSPTRAAGTASRDTATEPSILIVEDEEGIRVLLEELLLLEGYKATAVDDAFEAITRFQEHPYDVVFTDLKLPGMSGATLARTVKELKPDTPVVILTGFDLGPNSEELKDVEIAHVLRKPFDMDEFLRLVATLSGRG